ncbi:MAG: O-antigen ligase family protein [Deltaproteobacteria bacterium]|nr:O-antigen ligase family protein [Candidatus Zymogenaceae bacterium]
MRITGRETGKGSANLPVYVVLGLMILFITLLAFLVSGGMQLKMVILILGIIATAICFFNTEMALYLIIFAMLFSPEFSFGGEIAEGRSLVLRVEDIIILVTFFSWVLKTALYEGVGLIIRTPLNRPIKIYVLVSLVTTLLGTIFGKVNLASGLLYVFKYMEYFLVFFMFANNITDRDQVRRFVIAALIVALFTALYAFIQIPLGARVTAPFEGQNGEPNTLGGYLILIISVLAGLWTVYQDKRLRLILVCFIGLLFVPFLFTLSRSSYLAAIPMFITLFIFSDKKLLLSFLLFVFILATPFLLPEKVKGRINETFIPDPGFDKTEVIGDVGFDSSTSERIYSFKYAMNKWRQHPLFGWGVTGVGLIDSTYFRLLAEMGLLGLLSFLYLIGVIGLYLYAAYRESQDLLVKGLALGMIAGTAALLGHSVGAASFIIVRIMEPYWFFMACVISLRQLEQAASPAYER